jgi:hypothetical protein
VAYEPANIFPRLFNFFLLSLFVSFKCRSLFLSNSRDLNGKIKKLIAQLFWRP